MPQSAKGFTLIELIVVMILISVLGAVGIGLFSAPSQYAVKLAADQWVSQLRFAQRLSFLRQSASEPVSLVVNQTVDNWSVVASQGAAILNTFNIKYDSVSVHASTIDFTSECSGLPLMGFPAKFHFDGYGNAVDASRTQLSTNQRICLIASNTVELCISPSGYAYEGSCLP
jgi:MSHA pilin protein MshC